MKPSFSPLRIALLVASVLLPAHASAQDDTSVPDDPVELQLEQFEPRATGSGLLNVQTPDVLAEGALTLGLWTTLIDDPLRLAPDTDADDRDERSGGTVVDLTLRVELLAAYGVLDGLELSVALPFAVGLDEGDFNDGDFEIGGRDAGDLAGAGLGDVRLSVTLEPGRLLGGEALIERWGIGLGLDVTVWLPTGDRDRLEGESRARVEPRLLLAVGRERWRMAADVGWHVRQPTTFFTLINDDQLKWRVGFAAPTPVEVLDLEASVFGAHHFEDQIDPQDIQRREDTSAFDPVEAIGALRWRALPALEVRAGGGVGLTNGVGSPAWRAFLNVGWGWPAEALGPVPFDPDPDDDGVAEADECPYEPESVNGLRDDDGCPERDPAVAKLVSGEGPLPDADGDGVPDEIDVCPDAAEDVDGFLDGDGCPDPDEDGDGIDDGADRCPTVAENIDGIDDADGCPEVSTDSDGDGIGDGADLCPTVPETKNGVRDWDGCPEGIEGRHGPAPDAPLVAEEAPLPPLPRAGDADGDGVADADDVCPRVPEDIDGFEDGDGCPEDDPDGDGLSDADDRCPALAETVNGIDDDDGCPDVGPDGDGDGVEDAYDVCPHEPETVDGIRDHDGCPERVPEGAEAFEALDVLPPLVPAGDPDGDGLAGDDDGCPTVAEDLDGFEDGDGCPEDDDDNDGVADVFDECARVAETNNFYNDADGCPDRAPSQVAGLAGAVERIQFKVGRSDLRPSAFPVLKRVVGIMNRYPRLRVQIDGHTDSTGEAERNFELSNDRAASVRAWFIAQGIAAHRLSSFGYGPDRPIASNRDLLGRFKNRRVELSYTEPGSADPRGGPP